MASGASSPSEGEVIDTYKANDISQHPELTVNDSDRITLGLGGASDFAVSSHQTPNHSPPPFNRKPKPAHPRSRSPSPYRRRHDGARSRSPFRHGRDQNKRKGSPLRGGRSDKRQHNGRTKHNDHRVDRPWSRAEHVGSPSHNNTHSSDNHVKDNHRPKPISYAEIENPNSIPNFSNGLSADRSQHHFNDERKRETSGPKSNLDVPAPKLKESVDIDMGSTEDEKEYTLDAVEDKEPTQEAREERKRRWAARRAAGKAKDNDGLLQQALTNASHSTTPNEPSPRPRLENSASPTPSPGLGHLDTDPGSPDVMTIDKQQAVFSERNSPSAADYDPTKDMLDDRDRAALKAQQPEVSSDTYKETDPKALSILPATKALPVKKQKKEFDMFASEDEDEDELEEPTNNTAKGTVYDEKLLDNWDDKDGYYKIINDELVHNGMFRMIKILGRGVYANVAQAEDVKSRKLVAIKIIRRNDLMRKESLKEIEFLKTSNKTDPQDSKHIIRLLGSFDHKGHLCIVFEHMSKNLRDLLKEETNGHGLTLSAVRSYSRQMFIGLQHLQDCNIIHLDLKPDNVLVSLDNKTIKLADFGTAVDKRDIIDWTEYLVSRFYRAPEIILGMDISYAVDMWAIGCTMYELWTGKILFTGRSNNQMIKAFMDCLGWPSEKLLKKGRQVSDHFEQGPPLKFKSKEPDMHGKLSTRNIEQQKKIPRDLKTRVHDAAKNIAHEGPTTPELNDFVDLLSMTLNLNPDKRVLPRDALAHRFISKQQTSSRSTALKPAMVRRGTPGTPGTFPIRR